MAVLLALVLCKGLEKLILYTHKEFTLRHKGACKAKWEPATSPCKLMNHWLKRASEVRGSVSSGNSHMHFWVRKKKVFRAGKTAKGSKQDKSDDWWCPLPTRNFHFWRRTAQDLGFPLAFYPHGPAQRDSLGLRHNMWHWFPKRVVKSAGWSSLLLTCPLLGWLVAVRNTWSLETQGVTTSR